MACNFKISVHKSSDGLHFKLAGDFDGSSACQLINLLKKRKRGVSTVFIHTNCLKEICPFGRNVFESNLDTIDGRVISFVFTGEKANQLVPQNDKLNFVVC